MAFKDFPDQEQGVRLLQRSMERGRLAHAYLFGGHDLEELEALAQTLAMTLNCQNPVRGASGVAIDSCDACVNCRKITNGNHADVHWVRPESKSRIVGVEQMRELMHEIHLKPTEAEYKLALIVAADRLNSQAANAFLKTLEEPPAKSILVLLTTETQRILETIISRCLRLNFAGEGMKALTDSEQQFLSHFNEMASSSQKSMLGRYRLMDVLLKRLGEMKTEIEEKLSARSPLQRFADVDKDLRDKWEDELTAAIEAEYRRQRADLLGILQRWLRDIWLETLQTGGDLLNFPDLTRGSKVSRRIRPAEALQNLQLIEGTQRLLHTNVQEALALEVGLLKLHL